MPHAIGDLAEVLDNLGVFSMHPEEVLALCPSGFRRVPITQGDEFYLSLQGFTANQPAYAHTHPDSESGSFRSTRSTNRYEARRQVGSCS